jgi:hypothetical protein
LHLVGLSTYNIFDYNRPPLGCVVAGAIHSTPPNSII